MSGYINGALIATREVIAMHIEPEDFEEEFKPDWLIIAACITLAFLLGMAMGYWVA